MSNSNHVDPDLELNFSLNVEQANLIIEALGNLAYVRVHAVIEGLRGQARQQLEAIQAAAQAPQTERAESEPADEATSTGEQGA